MRHVIDPRLLREDPDTVRAAQAKRGLSGESVDRALEADQRRRAAIADFEHLRAEQKSLSKLIPQAQGDERQEGLGAGFPEQPGPGVLGQGQAAAGQGSRRGRLQTETAAP